MGRKLVELDAVPKKTKKIRTGGGNRDHRFDAPGWRWRAPLRYWKVRDLLKMVCAMTRYGAGSVPIQQWSKSSATSRSRNLCYG